MKDSVSLFFRLVLVSIRSQMQHRTSFVLLMFSYFLATLFTIIGIGLLFDRFTLIQGWTFPQICVLYGIVQMGFSLAECFARGFDTFDEILKQAEFDRILLRPLGTLFQIACRNVQPMRLGRLLQAALVLAWGLKEQSLELFSVCILIVAILSTASVFYALFILSATLAFWTTESLELINITTYGGVEACQYPLSLYPNMFRYIFTFVIPLGFAAYYPAAMLLGLEETTLWTALLLPLTGFAFLYLSCTVWSHGVRRYTSTGN